MLLAFDPALAVPGRVHFGGGVLDLAGTDAALLLAGKGNRVFVVGGGNPSRLAPLLASLEEEGLVCAMVSVSGEPDAAKIEVLATEARAFSPDIVVGCGGGSVLDAAKAVAAMAMNPGPLTDYVEVVGKGLPLPVPPLPVLAIPTTAGTGSEATRNAVISFPERRVKVSLRHAGMLPAAVLVDPEAGRGVPRSVAVASGLDAICQLIESFVTKKAAPATDALCRDGLARAGRAFPSVLAGKDDPEARSGMAFAALASGITLANAGLGVVHGLAGPLGGYLGNAPHGALCAVLLPGGIAANAERGGEAVRARYAEAAGLLCGEASVEALIARIEEWNREGGICRLGSYGLTEADLPHVAAQALASSSMKGNPVALPEEILQELLRSAL